MAKLPLRLLLLAPAPALALWMQGWELTGSLCQGNLPPTCSQLCTSWSQSEESTCVAAAPNSIAAGKWSSLTLDTETSATFRLFSDATCTSPIPLCNFTGATVDGSCVHRLMCDPSVQGLETLYSYKFELIKVRRRSPRACRAHVPAGASPRACRAHVPAGAARDLARADLRRAGARTCPRSPSTPRSGRRGFRAT